MVDFTWESVEINHETTGQDLANLVGQHGPINFPVIAGKVRELMEASIDKDSYIEIDNNDGEEYFEEDSFSSAVDYATKEKLLEFLEHLSCVIDDDGERWTEVPAYGWIQYSTKTGTYLDEVGDAEDLVDRLY